MNRRRRMTDQLDASAIGRLHAAVNRRLHALVPASGSESDDLNRAMRYALLAPGKRIRPILTILASWEMEVEDLLALDAGCALEMVHAASLILDDLPSMDDARLRRGQPTTHLAFGEDVAILAAIGLLTRAFDVLGAHPEYPPAARAAMVAILSRAVGTNGLVGGQYRDLRESRSAGDIGVVLDGNHRKTGVLFLAAVDMAAEIAGVRDDRLVQLRVFATNLGHAFQILDDLLDGASAADEIGKDIGQDRNKATVVSMLGRVEAQDRLRRHLAEAAVHALSPDDATGPLRGFLKDMFDGHLARLG